jgi:hypothetical protein
MCRWLADSAHPSLLDELLYKPAHSLIDQAQLRTDTLTACCGNAEL